MTQLVKAQLCELEGEGGTEVLDTQFDVQFNPTSLRVAISNRSAGGQQGGSQARQRPGTGEIQVSFDLVFDTADEGTTGQPVSVTRKTQLVERFVRPPPGSTPSRQAPPRVQFKWGTFLVQGIMESANTDLDLFSADGTPLRAKVAVSIKGQDPSYSYPRGTGGGGGGSGGGGGGAGGGTGASPPGAFDPPPGAPGTSGGSGTPAKVAQAMPGESLSQLAARNGLDPAAWRALAQGVGNPLSLPAGAEIALPGALRAGGDEAGRGSAGADPAATAAKLPLVDSAALPQTVAPAASAPAARPDPVRQGQAVTRQGGVAGAIAQVRASALKSAVSATFNAFGMTAPEAPATHRPYGNGVPLRPLRGETGERAPTTPDPTVPGWQALPLREGAAVRALGRRPVDPCHCDCDATRVRGGRGG